MAVNAPESAVAPPYLHWRVSPAQAGTTFEVEQQIVERRWFLFFPIWEERGWTSTTTVTDCVAAGQCAATGDLDPDPGEFQVAYAGAGNRMQTDTSSRRYEYRVRPMDAPTGAFWENTDWRYSRSANRPGGIGDLETFNLGTYPAASCVSGTIYALSSAGIVTQVSRPTGQGNATLSRFDTIPRITGGGSLNALGIGPGGTSMFVAERAGNEYGAQAIHKYSVASGWQRTAFASVASGTVIVAGATNLMDGRYYFGGYRQAGNATYFDVWVFDPQTNARPVQRGSVSIPLNAVSNGDIAFDAAGNLFMLQNQQNTSTTRIYTVPASLLAAGGAMVAQTVSSFNGIQNINGFAFEADGRSYLSDGTNIRIYDPSSGLQSGAVTTGLSGTVDLAGCLSPVTLTIRKDVVARVADSDQFTLTAARGGATLGTARTTGNQTGVQQEQVGPITAAAGQSYAIQESISQNATSYSSSYSCVDERGAVIASGDGRSATISMPQRGGASVVCTFRNAPLIAGVVIRKIVEDTAGTQGPGVGWGLAAASTATTGSVTASPSPNQVSDDNGEASWVLRFGSASARAEIRISEAQQPGYDFVRGTCSITTIAGSTSTIALKGAEGDTLAGIAPGSSVECEFVNRLRATTLTLVKSVPFGIQPASSWHLSATGPQGERPGPAGVSGSVAATAEITSGATYRLSEAGTSAAAAAPYVQVGDWICVDELETRIAVTSSGDLTVSRTGASVTCTVTNQTARLTLLKTVVNDNGGTLDADDFTLTATPASVPSVEGLQALTVTGASSAIAANTREVRPGHAYALTEDMGQYAYLGQSIQRYSGPTNPTAAQLADDGNWATLTAAQAGGLTVAAGQHTYVRFINDDAPALTLPFTGGIGADSYLFGGAGALLLGLLTAAVLLVRTRIRSSRTEVRAA